MSAGRSSPVIRDRAAGVRFTLAASAVALALIADFFIRSEEMRWGVAPLIIAVACLSLAATGWRSGSPPESDESGERDGARSPTTRQRRYMNRERSWATVAAIVAVALMYVSLRNFGYAERESLTLAWYSFGAAVALALAAIPALDCRWTALAIRVKESGGLRISLRTVWVWGAVAAILVLGAGLRLYNLEDVPAGLWYDEADNLAAARQYALDPGQTPLYESSTNLPTMFLLPMAAAVKLAGVSMTTGRLVAAAFGLLGIVATFLLARRAFGTSAGLIAAFLVCVMRWDLNWSRIGMHGITGVLFAALTGWLTLRAIQSERASDYAFAGAAMGFGMWFYAPLRVFPAVVGVILLLHLIKARPAFRGFLGRVAIMAAAALFVAAPVVQFAAGDSDRFFERTRTTSLFNITPRADWADRIREGLVEHAMMFTREGDPNPRHNLPEAPMLDRTTGAMFMLGFLFALTRWRRRNVALLALPIWVILMTLPGVLTVPWESPQSLRAILVIPAVATLAALALDMLWRAWREVPWAVVRRLALPATLAILGIVAYSNVNTYFGWQANHPEVYAAFSTDETLMARSQIDRQRLGYSLWVSRQFLHGLTTSLLANHPRYEIIKAPDSMPLDSERVWLGAAAYFEPRERGLWEAMRAYYPKAEFQAVAAPAGGEALFYTGFASRKYLADSQGLDATYTLGGVEVEGGRDSVRDSTWVAAYGPNQYPYRLSLAGALKATEFGEYGFELYGDGAVELNGQLILNSDADKRTARVVLASGLHSLKISGEVWNISDSLGVLWTVPGTVPGGAPAPVPFGNLYRADVRPLGLAGRYYAVGREDGTPDAMVVVPTLDLFHYDPIIPEPYTAIFEGGVAVDEFETRQFRVARHGGGRIALYVDGQLVAQEPPADGIGGDGEVALLAGSHQIKVEYSPERGPSQFEILWAGEDGRFAPIPVESLTPAAEGMMAVVE